MRNDAGKTTTIRMLPGLAAPSAGQICLLGRRFPDRRAVAQVGLMIEEPAFYPWMTGRGNLEVLGATGVAALRARSPGFSASVARTGLAVGVLIRNAAGPLAVIVALLFVVPELLNGLRKTVPDAAGSATAGSPSALTAMAIRMVAIVSATRPSFRSVPASNGGSVQTGATISGWISWNSPHARGTDCRVMKLSSAAIASGQPAASKNADMNRASGPDPTG